MRKCLKCSAELENVDMVCTQCGSSELSEIIENEHKKLPKIVLVIAAAVLVIVVAVVVTLSVCTRSAQVKNVESGISAIMNGDVDGYINSFAPELRSDVEQMFTQNYSADEYRSSQIESLKDTYGNGYDIEVTAIDVHSVSSKMLSSINEDYGSRYSAEFNDAKYVTVKMFIRGKSGVETMTSKTVFTVKTGKKWYLLEDFIKSDAE